MADIVPFGKYKGQPVSMLLADQDYLRWVLAQPGLVQMLQERHPTVLNIITIGAPQSDDTPEHNRLQARFLDHAFGEAFIECVTGKSPAGHVEDYWASSYRKVEHDLEELKEYRPRYSYSYLEERLARIRAEIPQVLTEIKTYIVDKASPAKLRAEFELGFDVRLTMRWNGRDFGDLCYYATNNSVETLLPLRSYDSEEEHKFNIELKPTIGDDFPAVLRQIRRNGAMVVVAERFEAVGATLDQVRKMFGDRKLVLVAEIEALMK